MFITASLKSGSIVNLVPPVTGGSELELLENNPPCFSLTPRHAAETLHESDLTFQSPHFELLNHFGFSCNGSMISTGNPTGIIAHHSRTWRTTHPEAYC